MYVMTVFHIVRYHIFTLRPRVRRNDWRLTVGANNWAIKCGCQQIKVSGTTYRLDTGSSEFSAYMFA